MPGLNHLLPGVPEGPEERRCLDEGEFNLLGVVVGVLLCGWTGGAVDFLAVGCLAFLRALTGMEDFLTAWRQHPFYSSPCRTCALVNPML